MRTQRRWIINGVRAAIVLLLATIAPFVSPGAASAAERSLTIIGVPGLQWRDVDATTTPALWGLVGQSAVASMAARATSTVSCPDDAWASISAGNRARSNYAIGKICPRGSVIGPPIRQANDNWVIAGKPELTRSNAELSAFKAKLGLLAKTIGCAAAIGPGAAVAAMHPDGAVDRYRKDVPETADDMTSFTRDCLLTIVDPQVAVYGTGTDRKEAAAVADAAVAATLAVLPADAPVMVVGISDATAPANLHPMIIRAEDYKGRWLTSAGTRRAGYTQLVDIGPTAVAMTVGGRAPDMTGQPVYPTHHRGGDTAHTVATSVNANLAGLRVPPLSDGYYSTLTIIGLIVVALTVALCRRRAAPRRGRFGRFLAPLALTVAALPVSTLLANAFPWWRTDRPASALWGLIVGISVVLAAVSLAGPWRRSPIGPATLLAGITAAVIGVDAVIGTPLQFNSLAGYSAIVGARFTGMGNYAFGIFAAAAVIFAMFATVRLRGWWRIAVMTAIAGAAILVDGSPVWGNDVGGVIAMTPAFILAGLHALGKRLSVKKILLSLLIGGATITVFGIVDYLRPPETQTHLGRFVAEVLSGDAGETLIRKASAALHTVTAGPLTLLVIGVCVAIPLLWHTRVVNGLLAKYPVVLSAGIGVATVCVIGFATNDSGMAVPAFALSVAAPLFLAIAARYSVNTAAERGPVAALASSGEEVE
ncbi:hypothetical protein [Stackebrandtia soli]|uniref:hypothetical protein n=1 Tax=Stackebrandtia soli TaxID=1892856 RepID=UPI0039EC0791